MASIQLQNVGLHLPILGADARLLRKIMFRRHTGGTIAEEKTLIVRALENLSFHLEHGDRLGLVGHNGSGKTTLLRLLAGVFAPTGGTITIEGRVSALLNPGLGMDAEDTGYDNIRNIGMMLGMNKFELAAKFDEIAEFTELGGYLALPVRTYSAGMHLRLAFSVVTAIEPDILLLDEGLGAGDARFASKALARVDALIKKSNIMVLASHSEQMIREMCNKALLLDQGRCLAFGSVGEVFERYRQLDEEIAKES